MTGQPSTEDRVEAMRSGHEPLMGLTLEEDEERLMRIAIRESAAESTRGVHACMPSFFCLSIYGVLIR